MWYYAAHMRTLSLTPLLLVAMVLLVGCGTAQKLPVAGSSSAAEQTASSTAGSFSRQDMEAIYNQARASVDEVAPDAYFKVVEEVTKDPERIAQFHKNWALPEAKRVLKDYVFSELSSHQFIDLKQEGEWAGYYFLSDLEDKERLNLNLFRFHLKDGRWMVYPKQGSVSLEAPATEEEKNSLIKEEISENTTLTLKPSMD